MVNYPTLPVREATYDDYLRVHTSAYLDKLRAMASGEDVNEPPRLNGECTGLEYCLPGYLYSLGGMLEAIDRMRAGVLERAYCFSLGGHHAYADRGHGYCLLNPQAAAARYAQRGGFERILIVDWDLHHGDGTQAIFAHDENVHCISIHSGLDLYMASVGVLRCGTTMAGEAVGQCNIPLRSAFFDELGAIATLDLPGRFYGAAESLPAFRAALDRLPWTPDLIMIFSGYDSHRDDGGVGITNWTDQDYARLTGYVVTLAQRAQCPVLSVHGGGYDAGVTLSAVVRHVEVLAGSVCRSRKSVM